MFQLVMSLSYVQIIIADVFLQYDLCLLEAV